jgi:hypothetical protein
VSQDGREYYAVSKDFNLKEAWNRNQKRDHGTAYNSYGEKLQVKEFWIRENVLKPIWREFEKNFRYCKSNGLTKLSKITAQARKIQSGNSKRNK